MNLSRFLTLAALLALAACSKQGDDTSNGYVDAMAAEHGADTTDPSPAAEVDPARTVTSTEIAYTESGNELVYGYLAAPADMFEPLPAVIMIHEWWGLNDNIRAMADRLAAEGYMVFAVDLYAGRTADTPGEARELMLNAGNEAEALQGNIRAAYEFLEMSGAPKIASLGWCFGGGWSLNTAMMYPDELDAAGIYYGRVTDNDDALRPINAPILGLFAEDDRGIPVETAYAFRRSLERLRKDYIVHVYPNVGHAFANPTGQRYDREAAEDAWRRTLDFLKLHLAME